MNQPVQPSALQKIGNELAIAWQDGEETYLLLETLRRSCPCASCGGEPDVLGQVVRLEVQYGPQSFELAAWDMVGGYGWQPRWGDGHRTGIFPFPYLKKLGKAAS